MRKSKPLSKQEYGLLKQLLQMKQETLLKTTAVTLKKYYGDENVAAYNCGVMAIGDIPILLVAHLDTVFPKCPAEIIYDTEQNIMISPTGLGADDRVGVYLILQLVKAGLKPHVLFCTDEETGGKGAKAFSSIPCPFTDLKYMIELDRQGEDDCVFYNCDNPDFTAYVESFGFKEDWGTFSDISCLAPAWGIAAVNLSVGYRDEHSPSEVLFVEHMNNTFEKVKKMLKSVPEDPFIYIKATTNSYLKFYEKYASPSPGWDVEYGAAACKCEICGSICDYNDVVFTEDDKYICLSCLYNNEKVDWCDMCGDVFIKSYSSQALCDSCAKKEGLIFGNGIGNY